MSSTLRTIGDWGRMVKLSHTIFALPFAFSGAALAATEAPLGPARLGWITLAMFCARNAAMGFNRLVDQSLDAENPRTADRELPAGRIGRAAVWTITALLVGLFVFAAFRLNRLCGLLSPVALLVILGYSFTKRFTWASHLVLGLGLSIAPVGAWLAVTGRFSPIAWWLALAVASWVAGFDVIYACQDIDFDRRRRLFSIPARFGPRAALVAARSLHVLAVLALGAVGVQATLHPVYWVGLAAIAALLVYEHRLVRADDLSAVGKAFFNVNAIVALLYLATVLASVWLGA